MCGEIKKSSKDLWLSLSQSHCDPVSVSAHKLQFFPKLKIINRYSGKLTKRFARKVSSA